MIEMDGQITDVYFEGKPLDEDIRMSNQTLFILTMWSFTYQE